MPDIYDCEIVKSASLIDARDSICAGYAVFSITVKCGKMAAAARAGQFIHVKCGDRSVLRRPFGISSVSSDELTFVFELVGEGTRWLSCRKPGDALNILGPLGTGFDIPESNIIVVGGGLGAPPMLFAAESAKGKVTAVLGFTDSEKVILEPQFDKICGKVYLTTDDGSAGIHGLVTDPLKDLLSFGEYAAVLACGPLPMLRAVAELCIKYSVPCQVSLEERMGCGVGACLVCACATRKHGKEYMSRVCKDGPVFDAAEVAW